MAQADLDLSARSMKILDNVGKFFTRSNLADIFYTKRFMAVFLVAVATTLILYSFFLYFYTMLDISLKKEKAPNEKIVKMMKYLLPGCNYLFYMQKCNYLLFLLVFPTFMLGILSLIIIPIGTRNLLWLIVYKVIIGYSVVMVVILYMICVSILDDLDKRMSQLEIPSK